jgi:beta-galactosidase
MKSKKPESTNSVERFRLMWTDVVYQPGELKAVAYLDGKAIGEGYMKTAGEPYRLKLIPDRKKIHADGTDLSYILIEATDKDGNLCPLADNKINLAITGPGEIAGVGNGNPQSNDPFRTTYVRLFYGKAMVIIGSGLKKGSLEITASSDGMAKATATIKVE